MVEIRGKSTPDLRNPLHLLAFGFGSGLAPKAPGTFGTLVALPLYLVLQPLPIYLYLALVALGFIGLGVCFHEETCKYRNHR